MRISHKGVVANGLTDQHFDRMIGHLNDTLNQHLDSMAMRSEIVGKANDLRNAVLGR